MVTSTSFPAQPPASTGDAAAPAVPGVVQERGVVPEDGEGAAETVARPEVGVGPWEGEWPEGGHWDPELLREGDRRNVADKYRYWLHEAIVADLDTGGTTSTSPSRTGSTTSTSAPWCGPPTRSWPRKSTSSDDAGGTAAGPWSPTATSTSATTPPWRTSWPGPGGGAGDHRDRHLPGLRPAGDLRPAPGLRAGVRPGGPGADRGGARRRRATLSIEQFGSTRSINAASAAGIAMHAWIRRHVFGQRPAAG